MRVSLHPKAAEDLQDAIAFYRHAAGPGVAQRLLEAFEHLSLSLLQNPGLGTPQPKKRKAHPLRGFPYWLVYRESMQGIRVLALRHQRRHPSYGNSRP